MLEAQLQVRMQCEQDCDVQSDPTACLELCAACSEEQCLPFLRDQCPSTSSSSVKLFGGCDSSCLLLW